MKKTILICLFLMFTFLSSCSSNNHDFQLSYTYNIDSFVNKININWNEGRIKFVDKKNDDIIIEEIGENGEYIKSPLTYSTNNGTLTIDYSDKKTIKNYNKDLIIYYDFNILLEELNFTSYFSTIYLKNQSIQKLNINSNLLHLSLDSCKISELEINAKSNSSNLLKNKIEQVKMNCSAGYINFSNNITKSFIFNSHSVNLIFKQNSFDSCYIDNYFGKNQLSLNGNVGFIMNLVSKTFSFDFETINYLNSYFYLDGKNKITILSPQGDTEIKRYFA